MSANILQKRGPFLRYERRIATAQATSRRAETKRKSYALPYGLEFGPSVTLWPDILLPAQLKRPPGVLQTPERRLMLAILDDAVWCFQRYLADTTRKGQRMFRDAERWLFRCDWSWTFSFERICETLELNPVYIRSGLHRWRRREENAAAQLRLDEFNRARNLGGEVSLVKAATAAS